MRYLEQYFTGMKMGIYWGSAMDFTRELKSHLDQATTGTSASTGGKL
jgi:hypothetical protein